PALPAEERARLIAERIATVAANPRVAPESLRIVEEGGRSDIMAGDRRIVSVVEADADVEDVSRPTLATINLHRIQGAIQEYRRDRRPEMLHRAAVRSVAAGVTLLVGAFLVIVLWRRFQRWLDRRF